MNICSPQLGISPESKLGGEVFDREILLGLAKKGQKINIILPKGKPFGGKTANWSITYIPFAHFPPFLFNFLIIPTLFKIEKKEKIDIIRLHQPQFVGLGAIFFKIFKRRIKIIATYHQYKETSFGILSSVINNYWDHIICDSEFVKSKINKLYNVPLKKITVVHNGVPKYLRPFFKNKALIDKLQLKKSTVILFMGLFINRKNPLFLLDLLSELIKLKKEIVVIFWGDGPLKKEIQKKANSLGLSKNIRFIPPKYGPEKNKIHNLADIFVHPSLEEGFALAPLEAMACGKPVIISKAHSAQEAVKSGVNGLVARVNDINDWTQKILLLIKNPLLRKKMGENASIRVKKEFQWEISVYKHLNVINSIYSKKAKSTALSRG